MAAKKAPKGMQAKVESITVRLQPKLKYGLELLARKQHRTLSSVIEWAIDKALRQPEDGLWFTYLIPGDDEREPFEEERFLLEQVWDPEEADRLVKLAIFYPSLLSYEEEMVWKLICSESIFWSGSYVFDTDSLAYDQWRRVKKTLQFEYVRDFLSDLKAIVTGEGDEERMNEIYSMIGNDLARKDAR